jgi:hypothetical protein
MLDEHDLWQIPAYGGQTLVERSEFCRADWANDRYVMV